MITFSKIVTFILAVYRYNLELKRKGLLKRNPFDRKKMSKVELVRAKNLVRTIARQEIRIRHLLKMMNY